MGDWGVGRGRVCALLGEASQKLRQLCVIWIAWGNIDRGEAYGAGDVSDELGGAREGASGEPAVGACNSEYITRISVAREVMLVFSWSMG